MAGPTSMERARPEGATTQPAPWAGRATLVLGKGGQTLCPPLQQEGTLPRLEVSARIDSLPARLPAAWAGRAEHV